MTSGEQETIEFKDGPYLKVAKKKPIFIGSLDIQVVNDYVSKLKDLPKLQKAPENKDWVYSTLWIFYYFLLRPHTVIKVQSPLTKGFSEAESSSGLCD